MGLMPLIKGLPVRLTDHIDRNLGLYKQTKCTIHGWTLNVNEARTLLVARTHLIHRMCLFNTTCECLFHLLTRVVRRIFHLSISARCPTSMVSWDVRWECVSFSNPMHARSFVVRPAQSCSASCMRQSAYIDQASAEDGIERVLELQPDLIYLKFENAKWRVHADLEKGVYPLKVSGKVWNISEGTKMKVKRWGWSVVPDSDRPHFRCRALH